MRSRYCEVDTGQKRTIQNMLERERGLVIEKRTALDEREREWGKRCILQAIK